MKQILLIAIIILGSSLVTANLEISQILYDGEGSDEGQEFIEIHNSGIESKDLSEIKVELNSGAEWELIWNGECEWCELQSGEFYVIGEINESDSKVDLTLPNTRGAIRLLDNNSTLDLVGYGESSEYTGSPAIDVSSNMSLIRIENTGNNFADFIEGNVLIRNQRENIVSINVENRVPVISNYSAIRVENIIILESEVSDANNDSINLEIECEEIVEREYNKSTSIDCEEEQISIRAGDSIGFSEWINLSADKLFEIKNIAGCESGPGEICEIKFDAISNGDIEVDLELNKLSRGSKDITVDKTIQTTFSKQERKEISLEFEIPLGLTSGEYRGNIELIINT